MTDPTYTHMVVDRSGSMQTIQGEAESGVNAFIAEQARLGHGPGEANDVRCTLTLVQFDVEYDVLFDRHPIAERGVEETKVPHYELVPRGMTALHDAMGRAAVVTGESLAALDEHERPGQVYFVVMTDGLENSSREWTKGRVVSLLKENQTTCGWQVTYLGANQDAVAEAAAFGGRAGAAMTTTPANYGQSLHTNSAAVARSRNKSYAAGGQSMPVDYTDEEREAAAKE